MDDSKIKAALIDQLVVIKVEGRGSFLNSRLLRDFLDKMILKNLEKFIFDLTECKTMDSTFMGTLAGLSIKLKKNGANAKISLVAPNKQCYRLITTLGLDQILNVRSNFSSDIGQTEYQQVNKEQSYSKEDKIINAIEAHENLIELDSQNEVKFKNVIALLKEDLENGS